MKKKYLVGITLLVIVVLIILIALILTNNNNKGAASSESLPVEIEAFSVADTPQSCKQQITVTTNADNGTGSLRQALANICAEGQITFGFSKAMTILLSTGPLTTSQSVMIDGSDTPGVSIDGNNAQQIMVVNDNVEVTLRSLVFSNGRSSDNGGAIVNNGGTLTLVESTLEKNNAAGNGGAIYNTGTLTLQKSTLVNNHSAQNGGIFNTGSLQIFNSTFSENKTDNRGGAIFNASGSGAHILNSTFSHNSAQSNGGAVANFGNLSLGNSLLVNSPSGQDCSNFGGEVIDAGGNLIQTGSCLQENSLDPRLDILRDNGGPTQTLGLLPGSPLIDTGEDKICESQEVESIDQRGQTRPVYAHCDSGSFEYRLHLSSITPDNSPVEGGIPIVLEGEGFGTEKGLVLINSVPCQMVEHDAKNPTTRLTCQTPAGEMGMQNIAVVVGGQASNVLNFSYVASNDTQILVQKALISSRSHSRVRK